MSYTLKINDKLHAVDVDGDTPLLWVLRDVLGMTGTKYGCGMALCGACTVHMDGAAIRSGVTPVTKETEADLVLRTTWAKPAGSRCHELNGRILFSRQT